MVSYIVILKVLSYKRTLDIPSGNPQLLTPNLAPQQSSGSPPPALHHTKRRQYAAGQTQAYYGAGDLAPAAPQYGGVAPQAQPAQLFTPGLAADGQFHQQQQQQQQAAGSVLWWTR
ncbi:hypothetical protein QCA50_012506 [Cerrena zonata]|uniref:Uncharacterized protein n=1 Tax=Cerrena zonata TaxID=2478898 RepID=A0AAW0FZN4_9APHY